MFDRENFKSNLFSTNESNFASKTLALFAYQWQHNDVYQYFCKSLNKDPENVRSVVDIPFLPIEFFKNHQVMTGSWKPEKVFKSSGTTSASRSNHFIRDVSFYHQVARFTFEERYGALSEVQLLAMLPSYVQQGDSSLISMVDHFMEWAAEGSRYVLDNPNDLITLLLSNPNQRKLLIGVSFALLDLAESLPMRLTNCQIMETGGMKGRRKELIREELHRELREAFGLSEIHSEYGMTELTSQAYGASGHFDFPAWATVLIRDVNDPLTFLRSGQTGGINAIDLANVDSCAFIETKDLGKLSESGTFEVLGRFDNSDMRGCNLMI